MNKKEIIKQLELLIQEHKKEYCTDWEQVYQCDDLEQSIYLAYDVGRYETLVNLLNEIKQ